MQCGEDEYLKARSAEGVTVEGTFALDAYVNGGASPPGETTTAHLAKKITFRDDRLFATKFTGLTTTYDPLLTGQQGSDGVAADGASARRIDSPSFTLEMTLDNGQTDAGRAYVVFDGGVLTTLYVQGYGHMIRVE